MKRRITSILLVVIMLFAALPIQAIAATLDYNASSKNNATITVTDEDGNRISDATVTVTLDSDNYSVYNAGDGQYKFTRYNTSRWIDYTITVSADGYETATTTMRGNSSNTTVSLVAKVVEYADFYVYYIADGNVPDNGYSGGNEAIHYGPAANNTPLVTITVNIQKLREIAKSENSPVVYIENSQSGNIYEFVPVGSHTDANFMDNVRAFWSAVLTCVDEASIAAFKETGLFNEYQCYCLKKQGDQSQHADGILDVVPPVYVIELYENGVYFGGNVTDQNTKFPTAYDVLDQYEAHLRQNITWDEDENGKPKLNENEQYTGTYIDYTKNRINYIYVYQFNDSNGASHVIEGSEIPYVKRTDTYYLAKFEMTIVQGESIEYVVTYTDGVDTESIFNPHEYKAEENDTVPAFTGSTQWSHYNFVGWVLDGDASGKIYSDADIALMTVTGDMTFHAVWEAIPEYSGTVKIVLNGAFDEITQEMLTGELVDITTVLGNENAELYVSVDNINFIRLEKIDKGVYSSILDNGTYHIYYSFDGGATCHSGCPQYLIMDDQNRTRYLFYYTVDYDLNGGSLNGSFENIRQYHHSTHAVSILSEVPVREGYIFNGWKAEDGTVFSASAVLTEKIAEKYTLTAQWIESTDVYVHIKLDHNTDDGSYNDSDSRHNVAFTIDTRTDAAGDFTEIYRKNIIWDGVSVVEDDSYDYSYITLNGNYTLYTAKVANLTDIPKNNEYTVTTTKPDYFVTSIEREYDENGDLHIFVEMKFDPYVFDFVYSVELDEEAKKLDKSLRPKAVNVKVTTWYDAPFVEGDANAWSPIFEYENTYERIELDENGFGAGRFSVWAYDGDESYCYRIEVVSYEMQDGTIIPAVDSDNLHETYYSEHKRYFANIAVDGGKDPDTSDSDPLIGAWYDKNGNIQQGSVKAIVSIPVYSVTFVPNGGILNGSADNIVLPEEIIVPDISQYVPTWDGGYTFLGWYLADENGNMTDNVVVSGSELVSDIVLIAKWSEPITVNGTVTVSGTYIQTHFDGTKTEYIIPDNDRVEYVTVLLQHLDSNGYYKTIDSQVLNVQYSEGEINGTADFAFEKLARDGVHYRVVAISANYGTIYQNEPNSIDDDKKNDFSLYNSESYVALLGEIDPNVATVNAYLSFDPLLFDLSFKVDSTQIGKDFRPDSTEVLVTYEGDPSIVETHRWPVISQMMNGEETKGVETILYGGIGNATVPVWQTTYNGTRVNNYGLCVKTTTTNGNSVLFEENPYFYIVYDAPAHYHENGEQSKLLVATLVPKTYNIIYDTNGGTIFGIYNNTHTWSYETELSDVVPSKSGYRFGGWYIDEDLTIPLSETTIDASVAENITFYAKWIKVNVHVQVVIDHTTENGGVSLNYEKLLKLQLTQRDANSTDSFVPVEGMAKSYDNTIWHTRGDNVNDDTLEVRNIFSGLSEEYDYNINATLDGYYVVDSCVDQDGETLYTRVVKSETNEEDGTVIDHYVVVCLKYNPDYFDLKFTVEMAEGIDKTMYPSSARVKVTCWFLNLEKDIHSWETITQHLTDYVEVSIDPDNGNGSGSGSYPVWQWQNKEYMVPYYYRIEVVALTLTDGTVVPLEETQEEIVYSGGGYTSTIYAENGCEIPIDVDDDGVKTNANTSHLGSFGTEIGGTGVFEQKGTLKAVIDIGKVVFHSNNVFANNYNPENGDDTFRTYYRSDATLPKGDHFRLDENGKISEFYDIPEFDYVTHNNYIFKGWYNSPDEDATPIDFGTSYLENSTETVHIYAHWINVGSVEKEDSDTKITGASSYHGYDLIGVQVRSAEADDIPHYGTAGSGLRFLTVLSESVYSEINAIKGNNAGAEYGFVMAKTSTTDKYANGAEGYVLEYKSENTNGKNTLTDYKYVQNMKCDGVPDHYNGENYRIYTAVVTYNGISGDALASAQATDFVARSYIRYYDSNGLLRTYYNNYTGTNVYNGCSVSYSGADAMRTTSDGSAE